MPNSLLDDFDSVSKSQWLAKIEKDLKGHSIADLMWHLPDLTIDPFAHIDDVNGESPAPIISNSADNTWLIGEDIPVENNDFKAANQRALTALLGGVNAPCFILDNYPSESHLALLLNDIFLEYISCHFTEKTHNRNPLSFLESFKKIAGNNPNNPLELRGGIAYDPFADGRQDVKVLSETILFCKENLPCFTVLDIQGAPFFKGSEHVVEELTSILKAGENYLKRLTDNGLHATDIAHAMSFSIPIGISYFIEIAKIRAFKLLWGNILKAYGISPAIPVIHAKIGSETQVVDTHTNKIRATTQAMSAVIGGVHRLTIAPSDALSDSPLPSNIRIARNVQHLLQMESYFDKVIDPAAGSYYIEALTEQIAEKVWSHII
jgi:methylmalonyl-CoA mutase